MSEIYDIKDGRYEREVLPSCADTEFDMVRDGWYFADRTLKVTIQLAKVTADLKRLQRLPIVETSDYTEDIFRIAHESFTRDRRFHVAPKCDQAVSAVVLRRWVDELGPTLVCLYHEKPIGFLNMRENFVHLAAVEAKYRVTGAAMGLYARAIECAGERGFKTLDGRISSLNTPVMNLYASFGAVFSDPEDVFLRKIP
ncbi:MAG: GNAT family N-acetyltransferase [Kiritimatiellae bacterium]|nr:GNAT family N-acetyltransferase [Kiritimatiellia bacterium]